MARLLVRHGADVQRADSGFSGRTAMHYVMETGNRILVNFLIQGVRLRMVPVPGPTPSFFGIQAGFRQIRFRVEGVGSQNDV